MTESWMSKQPPAAFVQHNQQQSQRTVLLTQQAIARLETAGQVVTLVAVCEATRQCDTHGTGLSAVTILRNPEAAALFRQHSPAFQARQRTARTAKHKRSKRDADTHTLYRGLRASDLMQLIEELKVQLTALKAENIRLIQQQNAAYQLRDEALRQNTRQLAALTVLTAERTISPSR